MTASDWATGTDPHAMLSLLRGREVSPRKVRLFAAACCRRVWPLLADPRSRSAVEAAERCADGDLPGDQLAALGRAAVEAADQAARDAEEAEDDTPYRVAEAAAFAASDEADVLERVARGAAYYAADPRLPETAAERAAQASLLRCVVANPLRPTPFSPEWRTSTAVTLAAQMYESRDFSAMPILADALMDAGCNNNDILEHCRGLEPHVRGCWVVDLVLGKE